MDLNEITHNISHWLAKHGIEREGVRIILEFPSENGVRQAEIAIKREIEPMRAYQVTGGTFGEIQTMNGLGLSLRVSSK